MIILIGVFYVVIGVIFAIIGSRMARSRQRDPAIWAVICFLFPLIGVLALALAGKSAFAQPGGGASLDVTKKWDVLLELDPDIRSVAERVREKGAQYERLLAQKYMALNDKSYLKAAEDAVLKQIEFDALNPDNSYGASHAQETPSSNLWSKEAKSKITTAFLLSFGVVASCVFVGILVDQADLFFLWPLTMIGYSIYRGTLSDQKGEVASVSLGVIGSAAVFSIIAVALDSFLSFAFRFTLRELSGPIFFFGLSLALLCAITLAITSFIVRRLKP